MRDKNMIFFSKARTPPQNQKQDYVKTSRAIYFRNPLKKANINSDYFLVKVL